jgi:CRISPR-associated endonuclease Cas2
MEKFLIAFDIPANERLFRKKINQILKKIGAKMVQKSLWESNDLPKLLRIAILIKNVGGTVYIYQSKVLFS